MPRCRFAPRGDLARPNCTRRQDLRNHIIFAIALLAGQPTIREPPRVGDLELGATIVGDLKTAPDRPDGSLGRLNTCRRTGANDPSCAPGEQVATHSSKRVQTTIDITLRAIGQTVETWADRCWEAFRPSSGYVGSAGSRHLRGAQRRRYRRIPGL